MNSLTSVQPYQASLIGAAALRFLLSCTLYAALVGLFAFDIAILGNDVPELSATELAQAAVLAWIVASCADIALSSRAQQPLATLAGGFFACLLMRELDALFDLIHHGLWLYPALTIALVCVIHGARHRPRLLAAMASLATSPAQVQIATGLAIVLVFSRLFGLGELWQQVMGEHYVRAVKNLAEEGLELLGYVITGQGVWRWRQAVCRRQLAHRAPTEPGIQTLPPRPPMIASRRRVN